MRKIYGNKDAKRCTTEVFHHTGKMKFNEKHADMFDRFTEL